MDAPAGRLIQSALQPGIATAQTTKGTWTDADKPVLNSSPILSLEGSAARKHIEDDIGHLPATDLLIRHCYLTLAPVKDR